MYQEGEITGSLPIYFSVIINYDAMGSAEQVCGMYIYKLFVVSHIVYFGNDCEKLLGRLRELSPWKSLIVLAMEWEYMAI